MGNVLSTFERIKHLHTPHYKFTKHLFLFRWISRGKKRFCINKEILSSSRSSITIILVFNWQTCYFFFNHKKWYFFLKPRKGCTFWHLKLEENILVSNILNTFFLFVLFFCEFIFFDCAKCLPNASCKNILNMIQTVVL